MSHISVLTRRGELNVAYILLPKNTAVDAIANLNKKM